MQIEGSPLPRAILQHGKGYETLQGSGNTSKCPCTYPALARGFKSQPLSSSIQRFSQGLAEIGKAKNRVRDLRRGLGVPEKRPRVSLVLLMNSPWIRPQHGVLLAALSTHITRPCSHRGGMPCRQCSPPALLPTKTPAAGPQAEHQSPDTRQGRILPLPGLRELSLVCWEHLGLGELVSLLSRSGIIIIY